MRESCLNETNNKDEMYEKDAGRDAKKSRGARLEGIHVFTEPPLSNLVLENLQPQHEVRVLLLPFFSGDLHHPFFLCVLCITIHPKTHTDPLQVRQSRNSGYLDWVWPLSRVWGEKYRCT